MHTFKQSSYKKAAFCLKSDLSKAFDRMSWGFIEKALSLHALPPTCVKWIMACMKSARFTILFQGQGDGIRQGFALSLYIFIICMNILSALLLNDLRQGRLNGLKLTRSTPPLTNLIYADNLLLLGTANRAEVSRMSQTLNLFCWLSGQRVSPKKSKLWFSKTTSLAQIRFTLRTFGASFAEENETYLGFPVDVSRPSAFQPLLQKMDNKLHAWKRLLTPAGKVILLKSILEAILTYQISTTMLHESVLNKMQSKCVKFF